MTRPSRARVPLPLYNFLTDLANPPPASSNDSKEYGELVIEIRQKRHKLTQDALATYLLEKVVAGELDTTESVAAIAKARTLSGPKKQITVYAPLHTLEMAYTLLKDLSREQVYEAIFGSLGEAA